MSRKINVEITGTTKPHKFIGFGLLDALRDVDLLPDSEKYLDCVSINAEFGKACKLIFRYMHTPGPQGTSLFSDEKVLVAWAPLFDALKEAGLVPMDEGLCRRIRIDAPTDKPCTITYECFADSRLIDAIREGAIVTEHTMAQSNQPMSDPYTVR